MSKLLRLWDLWTYYASSVEVSIKVVACNFYVNITSGMMWLYSTGKYQNTSAALEFNELKVGITDLHIKFKHSLQLLHV